VSLETTLRPSPTDPRHPPDLVWKRLSGLIAAPGRSRVRLWNTETDKFSDTAKLTERLPARPAATYLYAHRRTQLLCLDFDAKRYGPQAVQTDMDTAVSWITQCGGVIVADRSSSGGGHVLAPLAIGTAASVEEMVQLLRLLASRLPTLDITPATNAETGCITPPGSPCREGGYRQLQGSLEDAIEAFTTRSQPTLLPRLAMLLGALNPIPGRETPHSGAAAGPDMAVYTIGAGDGRRLMAEYVRDDPMPPAVADYATTGAISGSRPTWQSNHEPRQSVVVNAVSRGHSHASLRDMIAPGGGWHDGLGQAYRRYDHRADQALGRDVDKALDWLITNVLKSHPLRHKSKNTPGGLEQGPRGPENLRLWLANAMAWADGEYAGTRYRWTVHAVLQSLAFYAVVAGEQRAGTWLVGVGGRTLSLCCGLLSEDSVWRVLADLRDRPGAPLVLVRSHGGTEADTYALTSQHKMAAAAAGAQRVRIEPVHDGWIVVGHHLRRIYELITHHGLTQKADLYAAAAVGRSTGDAMVLDLQIAGLVVRTGRGSVGRGAVSLEDIAERQRLAQDRADRLERHRRERVAWNEWLLRRERERDYRPGDVELLGQAVGGAPRGEYGQAEESVELAYLESVMATGPPPFDEFELELAAVELIARELGGRIVAAAG